LNEEEGISTNENVFEMIKKMAAIYIDKLYASVSNVWGNIYCVIACWFIKMTKNMSLCCIVDDAQ